MTHTAHSARESVRVNRAKWVPEARQWLCLTEEKGMTRSEVTLFLCQARHAQHRPPPAHAACTEIQ